MLGDILLLVTGAAIGGLLMMVWLLTRPGVVVLPHDEEGEG